MKRVFVVFLLLVAAGSATAWIFPTVRSQIISIMLIGVPLFLFVFSVRLYYGKSETPYHHESDNDLEKG